MWVIEFSKKAEKDVMELPKSVQSLIQRAISERLETDPLSYGKPLRFGLKGEKSLRVSNYRILYKTEGKIVTISRVVIRRDAYK